MLMKVWGVAFLAACTHGSFLWRSTPKPATPSELVLHNAHGAVDANSCAELEGTEMEVYSASGIERAGRSIEQVLSAAEVAVRGARALRAEEARRVLFGNGDDPSELFVNLPAASASSGESLAASSTVDDKTVECSAVDEARIVASANAALRRRSLGSRRDSVASAPDMPSTLPECDSRGETEEYVLHIRRKNGERTDVNHTVISALETVDQGARDAMLLALCDRDLPLGIEAAARLVVGPVFTAGLFERHSRMMLAAAMGNASNTAREALVLWTAALGLPVQAALARGATHACAAHEVLATLAARRVSSQPAMLRLAARFFVHAASHKTPTLHGVLVDTLLEGEALLTYLAHVIVADDVLAVAAQTWRAVLTPQLFADVLLATASAPRTKALYVLAAILGGWADTAPEGTAEGAAGDARQAYAEEAGGAGRWDVVAFAIGRANDPASLRRRTFLAAHASDISAAVGVGDDIDGGAFAFDIGLGGQRMAGGDILRALALEMHSHGRERPAAAVAVRALTLLPDVLTKHLCTGPTVAQIIAEVCDRVGWHIATHAAVTSRLTRGLVLAAAVRATLDTRRAFPADSDGGPHAAIARLRDMGTTPAMAVGSAARAGDVFLACVLWALYTGVTMDALPRDYIIGEEDYERVRAEDAAIVRPLTLPAARNPLVLYLERGHRLTRS